MNFINDCNIYLLNINAVRLSAAVRCDCLLDLYDIRPIGLTALIFSARRHIAQAYVKFFLFIILVVGLS